MSGAVGSDRIPFIAESVVLSLWAGSLTALFAYSAWGRTRQPVLTHVVRPRAAPPASNRVTGRDAHTTTHGSGGGSGGGGSGGGGTNKTTKYAFVTPTAASTGIGVGVRGFPYYAKRVGLVTSIVCLIWSIDMHGSLGLLPLPFVAVLPDIGVTGLLATFSFWLYFHTLPLYRQLRRRTASDGHTTEYPVWLKRMLIALPIFVIVLNGGFDLYGSLADRRWGQAIGELALCTVISCYFVLVPVVTYSLRAELNRFSASVNLITAAAAAAPPLSARPTVPAALPSPTATAAPAQSPIENATVSSPVAAAAVVVSPVGTAPQSATVETAEPVSIAVQPLSQPQSPTLTPASPVNLTVTPTAATPLLPPTTPRGSGAGPASARGSVPSTPTASSGGSSSGGGGMVIDTSYVRSAIRTMFIFGGASEVLGLAVIVINVMDAADVLSRADAWSIPFPHSPPVLNESVNFSLYSEWIFLALILWVSWEKRSEASNHHTSQANTTNAASAAAAAAGGSTSPVHAFVPVAGSGGAGVASTPAGAAARRAKRSTNTLTLPQSMSTHPSAGLVTPSSPIVRAAAPPPVPAAVPVSVSPIVVIDSSNTNVTLTLTA